MSEMSMISVKSRIRLVGGAAVLWIVYGTGVSHAQDIYRVIDEDGNVSYMPQPPQSGNATQVQPAVSAPSESTVEAARQRQEDIVEYLAELQQIRAAQAAPVDERPAYSKDPNPAIYFEPTTDPGNVFPNPAPLPASTR